MRITISDAETGAWIRNTVLPKLEKWFGEMDECGAGTQSLRLVSFEAYNELYQHLKEKYVRQITTVTIYFQSNFSWIVDCYSYTS